MKIHKTDARFNLHVYGFTCYLEFNDDQWSDYNQHIRKCAELFGNEFWAHSGKVWQDGNWKGVYRHRSKNYRKNDTKRVYLRGEKFATMLALALSDVSNNVYL